MKDLVALPQATDVRLARDGFVITAGVFVSATCQDLLEVRKRVVKGIGENLCVAVAMEVWRSEQIKAEELCLRQIRELSSHYVGIFGHRRGFIPALLEGAPNVGKKSVTEAEYDWAIKYQRRIAVFLPRVPSAYFKQLQKLARSEPPEAKELLTAQTAFRARVARDVANLLDDIDDVAEAVNTVVGQWVGEIKLRVQQSDAAPAALPPLYKLGRADQMRVVLQSLASGHRALCFLIHGRRHMGHARMTERLRLGLETAGQSTKSAVASLSLSTGTGDLDGLVAMLSSGDLLGAPAANFGGFSTGLRGLLAHHDVFLSIEDVDAYEGGFLAWLHEFWQPLLAALAPLPTRRLFVLATVQQRADAAWRGQLSEPKPKTKTFPPAKPVLLPELKPFSENEVVRWLADHGGTSEIDALGIAAKLITRTKGEPDELFALLSKHRPTT